MAHSLSAIKRQRQSLRRRERNRVRQGAARTAVRQARELIGAGSQEEAQEAIRTASSALDRAARKGSLHPNNAARRKSRLVRQLNASQATPADEAAPAKERSRSGTRGSTKAKAAGRSSRSRSTKS